MNRVIEFKRYHFDSSMQLVNISFWGKCINGADFCSPSSINSEDRSKAIDCQFVGLTDKNGKKIFEGDIVRHHDYSNGACLTFEQYKSISIIECKNLFTGVALKGLPFAIIKPMYIEVIGNIYENPNLIN
jgi:uncharacterized phage protein (TIGR01671 family)